MFGMRYFYCSMQELVYIITAVFFGFSVLNIIFVFVRFFLKKPQLGKRYLDVADRIIVWTGVVYAGLVGYQLAISYMFLQHSKNTVGEEVVIYQQGPYLMYVLHLIALFVGSQLFWFSIFKRINFLRFFLALITLIAVKFEDYVIITTTLHRDYVPPGQTFFKNLAINCGLELITFGGVFFLVYLITSFGRNQKVIENDSEIRSLDEDI